MPHLPSQLNIIERATLPTHKVALTFDDGPNPPCTEELLEIFDSRGVRGTFFVLGKWVEAYPRTVERLLAANQVIGNHGYSHVPGECDFEAGEIAIAHLTGRRSRFIRAPYFNQRAYVGLQPAFLEQVQIVHADVVANDFRAESPQEILANIFDAGHLQGGSILCMHDGAESPNARERLLRPLPLVRAMPMIIDRLRDMGLEVVGLDEMPLGPEIARQDEGSHTSTT